MPNHPAPKSPGQGNATPNTYQKFFQNYNVGGQYGQFGAGGIAPVKPGLGTGAPQFGPAPGGYAWKAPGGGGAPAGGGETYEEGGALKADAPFQAAGEDYSQQGKYEYVGTEGGAPGSTEPQGFASWVDQQGDSFYNPYTGDLVILEDALAGLLEDDPRVLMEELLAEELGLIKSQEQAALAQQAGIYGAAGLGTSGAFSADIAGTKTKAGSAAASAHLSNLVESEDRYIRWRDRITDDELAISSLGVIEGGAYASEKNAIDTYADNEVSRMSEPVAALGWQVNRLYNDDLLSLLSMIKESNMSLENAQPLIRSLNQQWNASGLLFTKMLEGRHSYIGTGQKTSAYEVRPGDKFASLEWDVTWYGDSWERPSLEQFGESINWD